MIFSDVDKASQPGRTGRAKRKKKKRKRERQREREREKELCEGMLGRRALRG